MSTSNITLIAGKNATINQDMIDNRVEIKCKGVKARITDKEDHGNDDGGNIVKYGRLWVEITADFYPFYTWSSNNTIQQDGQLLADLNMFKGQKYLWITDVGTDFLDFWRIASGTEYDQIAITDEDHYYDISTITVGASDTTVVYSAPIPAYDGLVLTFDNTDITAMNGNSYTVQSVSGSNTVVVNYSDALTPSGGNGESTGVVRLRTASAHGIDYGYFAYISDCVSSSTTDYNGTWTLTEPDYPNTATTEIVFPMTIPKTTTISTLGNLNNLVAGGNDSLEFPIQVEMQDWSSASEYPSGSDILALPMTTKAPYTITEIG